jgi:hypothetical protein
MTWQIPAQAPAPKQAGCPDPVPIQLAAGMDCLGFRLSYRFSQDPRSSPRLFTALHVPLTTWLRHPSAGVDSYRRHLQALRKWEAAGSPSENPIYKLREWSERYGMVNPDDLDLIHGGLRARF